MKHAAFWWYKLSNADVFWKKYFNVLYVIRFVTIFFRIVEANFACRQIRNNNKLFIVVFFYRVIDWIWITVLMLRSVRCHTRCYCLIRLGFVVFSPIRYPSWLESYIPLSVFHFTLWHLSQIIVFLMSLYTISSSGLNTSP